jgi:hypothetical protein
MMRGRACVGSSSARTRGPLRQSLVAAAVALQIAWAGDARAGVPVDQATPEQKAQAQDLFTRALERARAGSHDDAVKWFAASHAIVESPNAQFLLARSLVALGKFDEAHEAYSEAIVLAKRYAATKKYGETLASSEKELSELGPKLGFVRVEGLSPSTKLTVAGRSPRDPAARMPVLPGSVEVVASGDGGKQESKRVEVGVGSEVLVSFTPPASPPPAIVEGSSEGFDPFDMGEGQRTTSYVLLGVGAVGMGLFAGLGAANNAKFAELEQLCSAGCPASAQSDIDAGKSLQTGANISAVVGAVGLAAGVGLLVPTFFADDPSASAPREPSAALRVRHLRLGLGSISFEGSFR